LQEKSEMPNIKELRGLADWTQAGTSRASGINRAKLSLAECGEIELSVEEDAALRTVLLRAIRARAERINAVLSQTQPEIPK
jgi:transcriptional regulator with XRE-family HTH domain